MEYVQFKNTLEENNVDMKDIFAKYNFKRMLALMNDAAKMMK
jgi:hypothetical protein